MSVTGTRLKQLAATYPDRAVAVWPSRVTTQAEDVQYMPARN
jgi:hypothetical protein